jgi:arylsulfatase A-like enzyme
LPEWAKAYNKELKNNEKAQELHWRIGYDPLCGTVTTDMAIAAMKGEQLGKGDVTDMLCISYSQTDVIGHEWSTRGVHTDDAYLQLDKDLSRLFKALDEQVGKDNYLLFLTADHGGAHNYQWMEDHKMNGGAWRVVEDVMGSGLKTYLRDKLGTDMSIINGINGYRIYLNHGKIKEQGLTVSQVKDALIDYARQMPHVQFVMDFEKVNTWTVPDAIRTRALLGYHPHRSGDLLLVLEAGWYEVWPSSSKVGSTHGAWNPYDSHIPLLFYGWNVNHGSTSREVHITDIAPTVTQMLHIQHPNACIGEPITEIISGD